MIFLEADFFRYAKFFTVIHIYSFQYRKCSFEKNQNSSNFALKRMPEPHFSTDFYEI